MKDRRSETSRANLGDHIPEALDPDGTVVASVRLPVSLAKRIDAMRGPHQATRSEWIRDAIERCAEEGTDTWRTIADRKDVEVRVLRGRLDEKDDEIERLKRRDGFEADARQTEAANRRFTLVEWRRADTESPTDENRVYATDMGAAFIHPSTGLWTRADYLTRIEPQPSWWCDPVPPDKDGT